MQTYGWNKHVLEMYQNFSIINSEGFLVETNLGILDEYNLSNKSMFNCLKALALLCIATTIQIMTLNPL